MVKNDRHIGKEQERARKSILARYRKSAGNSRDGAKHSWRQVERELGFKAAYLRNVAIGNRRASIKLLTALGIKPDRVIVIAAPCKKCGQVHVSKRCTKSKTFEDNAREYDAWLANPKTQKQLEAMLKWAETPPDQRPKWNA